VLSGPPLDPSNEFSITPNDLDGAQIFTITHPFHPLAGQQFALIEQRVAWGEPRVFFRDPLTSHLRSLPTAWTDLADPDPFVILSAHRAILRLSDLQALVRLVQVADDSSPEVQ